MPKRMIFLELAKIAKQRGNLSKTLYNVYLKNYARAVKKERAAAVTATQEISISKESVSIIPRKDDPYAS